MNQPLEQLKKCPLCGKKPDLDDDALDTILLAVRRVPFTE